MFFKWYHILTTIVLVGLFRALEGAGRLPDYATQIPFAFVILGALLVAKLLWPRGK